MGKIIRAHGPVKRGRKCSLLLNLLARAKRGWFEQMPIRIRNEKDQQIYVVWFSKLSGRTTKVERIKKCVHTDILYEWPEKLRTKS